MEDAIAFNNHRVAVACVDLSKAIDRYRVFGDIEIIHSNATQATFRFKDHYGYIAARTHERNRRWKTQ